MRTAFFIWTTLALCTLGSPVLAQDAHRFDPPWNDPLTATVNFTVPGIDNVPDLYGDIVNPQLVVFFAGNQFMCVDDLLAGFRKKYPQYERIFVETLPPGILAQQIAGGSLIVGNLRISLTPDIYTAGKGEMGKMTDQFSRTAVYASNDLTLMVSKDNPKAVKGLRDLARQDLRVSMPNPAWEGIGVQIEKAYHKAGGDALVSAVMKEKTMQGSTYLTRIHHRESPMRILYGQSDVAPVWTSELRYQQMLGHPVDKVDIPAQDNSRSDYVAGILNQAPHPEAAQHFMEYLLSAEAKAIYRKYGFQTE